MRIFLLIAVLLPLYSPAQTTKRSTGSRVTKVAQYSASSEWQKVTLKPTARLQRNTTVSTNRPLASAEPRPSTKQPATSQPTNPVALSTASTSVPANPVSANSTLNNAPDPTTPVTSDVVTDRAVNTRTGGTSAFRPAFTGDFSTNRNGWKAGNQGDYQFQIGLGRYSVRKRKTDTKQVAFSYVSLPPDINLNRADTFTIRVDVLADSGQVPTGGLLFGVRDSLNYCAFVTNDRGDVSIRRVMNGLPLNDYMSEDYFRPGTPVDRNRNRLTVRRRGDALHFYVNDREVRGSPYPFRALSGNGIGFTASGYWTQFQRLNVTLGP